MEIGSTYFEAEDDINDDALETVKVDQRAKMIVENIMQLRTKLNFIVKVSYLSGFKKKKIRTTNVALCRIVKTRKQEKRK